MKYKVVISKDNAELNAKGFSCVIRRAFCTALKTQRVFVRSEVNVLITDDEGIREINREHRQIDRATDVLSFPMQNLVPGAFLPDLTEVNPENGRLLLGDMVVSVDRIRAQAEEYGHSVRHELAYLTVHSCLHLLGYDHMDEGPQKQQMRQKEKEIMQRLKL